MTVGKSLESLFIPQTAKPGLGESSLLQGWKCGFICLGLRSPSCPCFPGLCFGEGCSEGWCVAVCRRRVPCWLWKVVVGDVWGGQGGSSRSAVQQPRSALAVRPGRRLRLLPRKVWKVSRAVPGAGKGLGPSIRRAGAE